MADTGSSVLDTTATTAGGINDILGTTIKAVLDTLNNVTIS
ncbi:MULTISPECIES: hypothetical protein [Rhodococcus]|nr:hypothetical protein [Rhodococcus sp. MTM3W5.2]AQA23501.1 hypothetical protein BTZ20_5593 [Rhodococcus sp. MTM3W5.2]